MSHYALIDEDNIVLQVIVAEQDFIDSLPDKDRWLKTSYNTHANVNKISGIAFRKNYASVGGSYDPVLDAFIAKKPLPSWILNEETCIWEPPINKHK